MKDQAYSAKKVNILDYFRMMQRYGRLIFGIAVSITILTYINAARKPDTYKAFACGLKPRSRSSAGLVSLNIPMLVTQGNDKGETIEYLMKSRRMADDTVKGLNLAQEWGLSTDKAVLKLQKMINTHSRPQLPIVDIWVFGRDPDLLVTILNFMITNLDKLNDNLNITTEKPLFNVLDEPRVDRRPIPKDAGRKALVAFLLVSLTMTASVFFWEYVQELRAEEKRAAQKR